MRVWLVEAAEPLPIIDGNFRYLRCGMLAQVLVAEGHTVTWWTSNFNHMRKQYRFSHAHSLEIAPQFQVCLLDAPAYERNISLKRVQHNWAIARAFARAATQAAHPPDVIFACLPIVELAEQAAQYAKNHNVPLIVDARDRWPDLYLTAFPPPLRGLARLLLSSEFRRAARTFQAAASLTAVSETYLNWALQYAKRSRNKLDRVFPLSYPLEPSYQPAEIENRMTALIENYGIRMNAMVVTFIGTFGASYDLETVIAAAKILTAGDIPTQIVLAGHGDKATRLQALARGLDNVVFTGWLDQLSMLALLRLSAVGLAAYTNAALQSLPNKPFEYMSAGLPLLSSLQGELETLIRAECIGVQYQAGNVQSLADNIRWLAAHPVERTIMGERARQLLEKRFAAEVIYPQLAAHLQTIARQPI